MYLIEIGLGEKYVPTIIDIRQLKKKKGGYLDDVYNISYPSEGTWYYDGEKVTAYVDQSIDYYNHLYFFVCESKEIAKAFSSGFIIGAHTQVWHNQLLTRLN